MALESRETGTDFGYISYNVVHRHAVPFHS